MAFDNDTALSNEELFKRFGLSYIALEADDATLEESIKSLSKAAAMFLSAVTPDYGEFDKMTSAIKRLGDEMDKLQSALMQAPDSVETELSKIKNSVEELAGGMREIKILLEKNIAGSAAKASMKTPEYNASTNEKQSDKSGGKSKSPSGKQGGGFGWVDDLILAGIIVASNYLMFKFLL